MKTRSALVRAFVTVVAIVQMAMPAVASVADAWLEGHSLRAPAAHADEPERSSPAPIHAADCVLCSFLTHFAPEQAPGIAPCTNVVAVAHIVLHTVVEWRAEASLAIRPRAPPSGAVV